MAPAGVSITAPLEWRNLAGLEIRLFADDAIAAPAIGVGDDQDRSKRAGVGRRSDRDRVGEHKRYSYRSDCSSR